MRVLGNFNIGINQLLRLFAVILLEMKVTQILDPTWLQW